ncbi:hydrolase [Capsulimonas corticalis]|uniref:Hydrolase n=1 Tax=Capsulimonas corticalis TaxID=2219043 RepID=A0A402CS86_9BACT|nr:isochorismatase family protein [Capsulimonas corticalis]BDI28293.1 hydrolase [Capsulimonas corticalis]
MTYERNPNLLDPQRSILVVVDMQDTLLRVIHDRERLLASVSLMTRTAALLDIPIFATTQNAARLGGLAAEIAETIPQATIIDKMSFSCAASDAFRTALAETERTQVVLCGVETHICVAQTAIDLVYDGYQAHVAADGVSSRTLEKHKLGMERIRDNGVFPAAAEAVVYEWLGEAGTDAFRTVLGWVK